MSLSVYLSKMQITEIYHKNITHNLAPMAKELGVYQMLWRPEEIGITKAKQLIDVLKGALYTLLSEPERFKKFNPANGWGDYDGFVIFVSEYLAACIADPDATVEAER